jgi:hypothetical protein
VIHDVQVALGKLPSVRVLVPPERVLWVPPEPSSEMAANYSIALQECGHELWRPALPPLLSHAQDEPGEHEHVCELLYVPYGALSSPSVLHPQKEKWLE